MLLLKLIVICAVYHLCGFDLSVLVLCNKGLFWVCSSFEFLTLLRDLFALGDTTKDNLMMMKMEMNRVPMVILDTS